MDRRQKLESVLRFAAAAVLVVMLGTGCATSSRFNWESYGENVSPQKLRAEEFVVKFEIQKVKASYGSPGNATKLVARHAEHRYPNLFGGSANVIPLTVSAYAGKNRFMLSDLYALANIFCLGIPSTLIPMPSKRTYESSEIGVTAKGNELGKVPFTWEEKHWQAMYASPIGLIDVPGKAKVRWCGFGQAGDSKILDAIWTSDEWLDFVVDSVATSLMKRNPGYYKHFYYTKIKPEAAFVP